MNTNRMNKWVVFLHNGRELLRYSLRGESESERQETIELLAYEKGIMPDEIATVEI